MRRDDIRMSVGMYLRLRVGPRAGAEGSMLCCKRMCLANASEREKDLSHSISVVSKQCERRIISEKLQTGKLANKRFFSGMRS
jgi:hypothetical protein